MEGTGGGDSGGYGGWLLEEEDVVSSPRDLPGL